MRELQVHQSGRVAYTGSSKGGKYYVFLNLPPKKSDFMLLTQKNIYIFLVFLTFSSRQPFQYHIKLYLYFQHIDCIPSIETNREEWSVTGLSCSHLRLRASTSHPTLMTAPSNFGSFSQWLSIPKTSMSNLWTWKSDQRLSKQLQVCRDQPDMQLYISTYLVK